MTTEPTLREKVLGVLNDLFTDDTDDSLLSEHAANRIADLLSATGAPAYIRVADDLRGVVREEEPADEAFPGRIGVKEGAYWSYYIDGRKVTKESYDAFLPHPARYLGQFDKRGGE